MKTVSTHRPLFIAAVALVALPFLVRALGLSIDSATVAVILAIATTGLNLCVGYTGLVSFGHSAWFGIGAYAAALLQRNVFPGEIWLPLIGSMLIVTALATVVVAPRVHRQIWLVLGVVNTHTHTHTPARSPTLNYTIRSPVRTHSRKCL